MSDAQTSDAPGLTRMKDALRFYADKDNWRRRDGIYEGQVASPAEVDAGFLARSALDEPAAGGPRAKAE